jgi:TolA-binding protein
MVAPQLAQVQSYTNQMQNQILNQAANTQKTINDNVKRVQDQIGSQMKDTAKIVKDYAGTSPGAKKVVIVGDDGNSVDVIQSYKSPDGSINTYSRSSTASYKNGN